MHKPSKIITQKQIQPIKQMSTNGKSKKTLKKPIKHIFSMDLDNLPSRPPSLSLRLGISIENSTFNKEPCLRRGRGDTW